MKKIVLASKSPRKKELLKQFGIKFTVDVSNIEEKVNPKLEPKQVAKQLSLIKAKDVARRHEDAIIIAADTFVVLDNEIIGKPKSEGDAKKILKKLSNKPHLVMTGFTVIDTKTGRTITKSVETKVYFKKLTTNEIDNYVKSGEPLDKAGAYGIQEKGAIFIEKIEGDYSNVIGLPIFKLMETLKEFGVSIL